MRSRRVVAYMAALFNRVNGKERPSRVDFVQHQSQRVDIRSLGDSNSGKLLRRHVRRRAGDFADGPFAAGDRQAEIQDSDLPPAVDHYVRRLEVAMQDAALMSGREPCAKLACHIERLL